MVRARIAKSLSSQCRWWGLCFAAGLVVGAATLTGFLGRFSWFLDLFSHFRVQYFGALLVLTVAMSLARKAKSAAVLGALALMNLVLIVPLYFGRRAPAGRPATLLRAVLMNVRTTNRNHALAKETIRQCDPDFFVIAELDLRWQNALADLRQTYPHIVALPRGDNFGIGFYSRVSPRSAEIVTIGEAGVPSVVAEMATASGAFTIVATHPLPPANAEYSRLRNEQFVAVAAFVRKIEGPVLLLGDLNVTPWSHHFRRFVRSTGLLDSLRGYGIQRTWPTHNWLLRIPIDHCLHSPEIHILDRQVGPAVGSDHFPLIVDFAPR